MGVVLVRRYHAYLDALARGAVAHGADDVVRLEARHLQDGDAVGLDQLLDDRDGAADVLGRCLALRFVGRVGLVAERLARRVERDAYVVGLPLAEHFLQGVDEAVDGRDVLALRVKPRRTNQRVVGAIYQCVSV